MQGRLIKKALFVLAALSSPKAELKLKPHARKGPPRVPSEDDIAGRRAMRVLSQCKYLTCAYDLWMRCAL